MVANVLSALISGMIVAGVIYLLVAVNELRVDMKTEESRLEYRVSLLEERLEKSISRVGNLENGVHYVVFKKDYEWGASYISDFGSDGEPYFYSSQPADAMKFNLKRAQELKKQWGVLIKNTMTGEVID